MFGFLRKDPLSPLRKKYRKLMEEAMHIQRSGDLKLYAVKMQEAEQLAQEIELLQKKR